MDIKQELLEEVFIYWRKYKNLTLVELNEKLIDEYAKDNNNYCFEIKDKKLLDWLRNKNNK